MGLGHALHDHVANRVVVVADRTRLLLDTQHGALHGPMRGAADLRGTTVCAYFSVDGVDVHAFPH